ncbi:hypothetical protein CLV60_13012 [Dyadobacter jiangsuensis]|uniref:Uncharacterized protein n=1 Tax=Dyadobacter jiangsuensis TaxID=1591085 RepID=A0A2P8FA49_9BACT|nr:hypothetical protein CLV60_13012 [Dyadobacter jiangsuensis]
MLLLSVGCVESNTEPEIYERDKCYEGTFIRGDCPSIAFVQLINSDLGTNWTDRDTVYQNVLVIKNYPDSLVKSKEKIFFTIDVDGTKNKDNCLINDQLCPQYIPQITDVPSVCIKSISTLNCN